MARLSSFLLIVSFFILSCTSNEVSNSKDVNPESIYFDYKIWGDEDAGYITARLQYRFAGRNGSTLILEEPSKAELDGEILKADSSKMNGVYYEISRPVQEFAGRHTIVFTDKNNKQYKEEFNFQSITLRTNLPDTVTRGDLVFELEGLAPRDYVRILFTDTAAFSEGISRVDTVENGRIVITKSQLNRLANGPVHLEFSKEDDKRIKNGTKEGGSLSISYWLKRDFQLQDTPKP